MNSLRDEIKEYLLDFDEKKFENLTYNSDLIKLSKGFLRRNGVVQISNGEFNSNLFIALKKNRASLLLFLEEEMDNGRIVGRVVNHILKEMGKDLYANKKIRSKEIQSQEIIDLFATEEYVEHHTKGRGRAIILSLFQIVEEEKVRKYREAMKAHLGLHRPYKLPFDVLQHIFDLKKSTFYKKLKEIREKAYRSHQIL